MQYYDFQPDLVKAMPILSQTTMILTDDVDANSVQDTIIHDLLPGAFSMLGTKVRLILVTVSIVHDIAYWDLIFEFPEYDKALPILDHITQASYGLEDSYDHMDIHDANHIYKLSFKVG